MGQYDWKVLVVEDDAQIREFLCYALGHDGFGCETAATGAEALAILASGSVGMTILDLGLPDMDGSDVIMKIRARSDMPIIVISAKDQDIDKVAALDLGADDYLAKPFSASELMARIRVAVRHMSRLGGWAQQEILSVGGLSIDLGKRKVILDDEEQRLTPMEYDLLSLLFRNIGKAITTKSIIADIWGAGYGSDTQALRALMAGLRRKIEKNPAKPRYIMTEIGVGYRLVDE